MARKVLKKLKKKQELPSFLVELTAVPENVDVLPKTVKSVHHLGPVFFGCHQYHPTAHSFNFETFHHTQHTKSSTENILRDIYTHKPEIPKKCVESKKPFHLVFKHQKSFVDLYSHKCPGTRKVFVPEVAPKFINFGQTNSVIEDEKSIEIPLYRLKKISSATYTTEVESVEPSDIWEERRIYMTKPERMAHAHFPKRFVTVILIGPTIPADLIITKLPSKRKSPSDVNIHINSKENKKIVVTEEITESVKTQVEDESESKKTEVALSTELQKYSSVKFVSDEENDIISEVKEESYSQESESIHSQRPVEEDSRTKETDQESIKSVQE